MRGYTVLLLGVGALGLLAWVAIGLGGWTDLPGYLFGKSRGLPAVFLPLPGVLIGVVAAFLLSDLRPEDPAARSIAGGRSPDDSDLSLSLAGRAVAFAAAVALPVTLLTGVVAHDLHPTSAVLILVCGSVTLLVAVHMVASIRRGEGLAIENNWGGLGGDQGGWRATEPAVLILVFLVALSATVVVSIADPETLRRALAQKATTSADNKGQTPDTAKPGSNAAAPPATTPPASTAPTTKTTQPAIPPRPATTASPAAPPPAASPGDKGPANKAPAVK